MQLQLEWYLLPRLDDVLLIDWQHDVLSREQHDVLSVSGSHDSPGAGHGAVTELSRSCRSCVVHRPQAGP